MKYEIFKSSESKRTPDGVFSYIMIDYDNKTLCVETAQDGRFVLDGMHWDFLAKNLPDYEQVTWLINNENKIRSALRDVSYCEIELPSIY